MSKFIMILVPYLMLSNSYAQMNHEMMSSSFSIDTRKPLPLTEVMASHQKQNMRGHLEAIRDLVEAFTTSDFKKIEDAGKRLGTSTEMKMMCEHMGMGAPGFTEIALKMHSAADKITEAGKKKNLKAAIIATHNTLQNCTACHALYKQEVLSDEEWKKKTELHNK